MGAGKISVVVGEFAVLVAAWNAGGGQQGFSPGPQLAVAAGDAAVVGASRLRRSRRPSSIRCPRRAGKLRREP